MTSATDELRRLLDERGVEYEGGERSVRWRDRNGVMMQAFPLADGELGMGVWSCTPEQAIAATLGSSKCSNDCTNSERTETCHVESSIIDTYEYNRWEYELSCGHTIIWEDSEPPRYCPECGTKVVGSTTNDVDAVADA